MFDSQVKQSLDLMRHKIHWQRLHTLDLLIILTKSRVSVLCMGLLITLLLGIKNIKLPFYLR